MKFIRTLSLLLLLLFVNFINAQVSVLAKVDHLVPDGIDTIGNINLVVSGSTAPYTYTWNPGSISTKDINNINKGSYTVQVKSTSNQTYTNVYSLGYKVLWTNLSDAYFRNDSLVSTQPGGGWYGTACSKNTLLPNIDGWFEYVIDNLSASNYYVGFLDSLSPISNRTIDIDYGIYYAGSSKYINFLENGTTGSLALSKVGDVVRIERVGNVIKYKLNNVLIRSTTVTGISQKYLKLKANLVYNTNRFINAGCSFANTDNISFNNYVLVTPLMKHNSAIGVNDGNIKVIPNISGTYTYTWQPGGANSSSVTSLSNGVYSVTVKDDSNNQSNTQYNIGYKVNWTNPDRAIIRNDTVLSTGSVAFYASANSKNTLPANTDGWFEYVNTFFTNHYYIGFIDSLSSNTSSPGDIDFGFYYEYGNNYLRSYQNGTTAFLPQPKYGDLVRLERVGNTINYKINGVIVSTITVSGISQKTWKLKVNLQANKIANVGCSFNKQDSTTFGNYVKVIPVIKHNSGTGINDGSISLKLKNAISSSYTWTPGAVNSNSITNLTNGTYSVNVKDSLSNKSNYKYEIGYKVQWTNLNRCFVRNDSLIPTLADNSTYSNAISKNTLPPNTDGWVEFPYEFVYYYCTGLTDSISSFPSLISDIDFGIWYNAPYGNLYYSENNTMGIIYYNPNPGDLIRIERIGNTIYYKVNGVVVRSVTNSNIAQKTLKLKANLTGVSSNMGRVTNVGCSFNTISNALFKNYIEVKPVIRHASTTISNDASIILTPRIAGAYTYTWQPGSIISNSITALTSGTYSTTITDSESNRTPYNYTIGYKALWKDFNTYCLSRNDSLISTAPTNNYGYACTKNVLNANTDGWFEYVIQDPMTDFYLGFIDNSSSNPNIINDINYGFYYHTVSGIKYFSNYESGGNNLLYIAYRPGDVLRLERIGNTINYKINGVLLRTVTNTNIGPKVFKLKAVSYYQNKLVNVGCSFTPCTYTASAGATQSITCLSPSVTLTGSTNSPSGSTYSWSPGGSAPTSSVTVVSAAGTYTLRVTDPTYGCVTTSTVSVISNLSVNATITDYENDVTKGSVNLLIVGGTAPYNIAWNGVKLPSSTVAYHAMVNLGYPVSIDSIRIKQQFDSLKQKTNYTDLEPGTYSVTVYDQLNDSVNLICTIGSQIDWVLKAGVAVEKTTVEPKLFNNTIYSYANSDEIIQEGTLDLGRNYAVASNVISQNDNNYIQFTVPDDRQITYAGIIASQQEISDNINYLKKSSCFEFLGDHSFNIWFNDDVIYNGERSSNDVFSISNNNTSAKISFYKNHELIIERDFNTLESADGFLFKLIHGSEGAKLKGIKIIGVSIKLKDYIGATITDVSCSEPCSGSIDAFGFMVSKDEPTKYELSLTSTPDIIISTITGFSEGNHALFTGLCAGNYTVKYFADVFPVFDPYSGTFSSNPGSISKQFEVAYKPTWVNDVNVTISSLDNSLSKTSGNAFGWDAGAASVNMLKANESGWIEWSSSQVDGVNGIGFSLSNLDPTINTINYGVGYTKLNLGIYGLWNLYVKTNNNTMIGSLSLPGNTLKSYGNGAIFRLEKDHVNHEIRLLVNGVLVDQFNGISASDDFILDASLKSLNGTISHPRVSFDCSTQFQGYAVLKTNYDASYYTVLNNHLCFNLDGDYSQTNLNYSLMDYKRMNINYLPINSTILENGDNRFDLNVTSLSAGFYFLEVTNQKNEKLVLKFKK